MADPIYQLLQILLLLLAWLTMDTESYLLQQNYDDDGWNTFWHRVRTTSSPNLLSSCPWDYVKLSDNTIHAQIFPFARIHCIDLYKSSSNGPAYDPYGSCQPIKSPAYACTGLDRTVNVGYTCVHSLEILTSKRNSVKNDTLASVIPPAAQVTATNGPTSYSNPGFISYTSGNHGYSSDNTRQGVKPGTFKNDTRRLNLYPPFQNVLIQRQNRTPVFLQGATYTDHSEIKGNQRPFFGMPPLERRLSLMDLIKGNSGANNAEEPQNSGTLNYL